MSTIAAAGPLLDAYIDGVRTGDRAMLARAITLVESTKGEHQATAQKLLQALLPATGGALRLGVTGVPGVGKSTTIDEFGMNLVGAGHRVAVLAVDPTSKRTGGSILGDKTRMNRLAQESAAFIRPSPTSGTLGGVTDTSSVVIAVGGLAFGSLAIAVIVADESEKTFANVYSTAVSVQNLAPRVSQRLLIVVIGTVATVIAYQLSISRFFDFLLLLGAVFVPLFGAVIAWLWLGESLTPMQLAGMATIIGGIGYIQVRRAG